jgi:hypothetical protein
MKMLSLLFLLVMVTTTSFANVRVPLARFSELHFDSSGNWYLEIRLGPPDIQFLDSFAIETISGRAGVNKLNLLPGNPLNCDSLFVVTNDNLTQPLSMNPDSGFVQIHGYRRGNWVSRTDFAYGAYPQPYLPAVPKGKSLVYLTYSTGSYIQSGYGLSNKPSIGLPNDTLHALGTVKGRITDQNSMPITSGWIYLQPSTEGRITIKDDGTFNEKIFSRIYAWDTLVFLRTLFDTYSYRVEPVHFFLQPDSVVSIDFKATTFLPEYKPIYGANDMSMSVVVAPNPFTERLVFHLTKPRNNSELKIFSAKGELIQTFLLDNQVDKVEWHPNGSVAKGMLLYRLFENGTLVKSGKVIRK